MTRLEISKRLQEWHHQAERILALFDVGGQSVQAQDQQKAKVLLINLKHELEAEHKRLSPKAEERLSPDEVAIYKQAVHEGFAALSQVRRNSTPDATWFSALDNVL